jgi:CRISPR system Cascade subunit CasE
VARVQDAIGRLRIRDSYDWHQRIWDLFVGQDGKRRDFLFRVDRLEEAFRVMVLSRSQPTKPDWCREGCFKAKTVQASYFGHERYQFSLLANPTKKLGGKRLALSADDLLIWMERKAATGGFIVETATLQIIPRGREYFRKNGIRGAHKSVEFRGVLTVTDPEQFKSSVTQGIGSAKAFGFGLLLLAPICAFLAPKPFSSR